jgi:hypothetical protein
MGPAGESQNDKANIQTQTDRRELLKLAVAAAAGAVATIAASDVAAATNPLAETEADRKRNIARFLNQQAALKTQLPARGRRPHKRRFKT